MIKEKIRELVQILHRDLCYYFEGGCQNKDPNIRIQIHERKEKAIKELTELFEREKASAILNEAEKWSQAMKDLAISNGKEIAELKAALGKQNELLMEKARHDAFVDKMGEE